MKKQLKAMLKLTSEDAERDFWASADSTDYVDWSKASRASFPALKPSLKTISLRMPEPMLSRINNPGASSEVCWFCKVMDCMRVNAQVLVRKKERSKLRGINPPANKSLG
jgi:hypothetical protein